MSATKYRQVFTVESNEPIPALHRALGNFPTFSEEGFFGEVIWTTPEPIIDVPNGLGAVVLDGAGNKWVLSGDAGDKDTYTWTLNSGEDWIDSEMIAQLLSESGAKILSRGYEGDE